MTRSTGVQRLKWKRPSGKKKVRGGNRKDSGDDSAAASVSEAKRNLFIWVGLKYASAAWYATDICAMAWHMKQSGCDALAPLAYNPNGEHFQKNASRVCRRVYGMQDIEDEHVHISVPIVDLQTSQRVFYEAPSLCLGDLLAEELAERPEQLFEEIADLRTTNWMENTVRLAADAAGDLCVPFGMFMDAAAWKGKGLARPNNILFAIT